MDLLVRLYALPELPVARLRERNVRRALAADRSAILDWIAATFAKPSWVDEASLAFAGHPIACFIASDGGRLTGFACYDGTRKGMFGPMGVDPACQGGGVGSLLVLAALHDMEARGYAYAAIGWAGPVDFYARTVGAVPIADSDARTGAYAGLLQHDRPATG